ncbi:unnamed protein product [Durusdinium trenchii]|uniref:Uncharacterized protein n=1 Tax=Durusdinium trenchii TaxID=1381693 RepID=A0ABP0PMW2_9DINO
MHSKWIKRLCALLPLVGTLAALPLSAKAGAVSQGQQNEQRHQNHALPPTPCCTFDIKASLLASSTAWRRSAASAGSSGLPNVHQRHEISLPCLHRPVRLNAPACAFAFWRCFFHLSSLRDSLILLFHFSDSLMKPDLGELLQDEHLLCHAVDWATSLDSPTKLDTGEARGWWWWRLEVGDVGG